MGAVAAPARRDGPGRAPVLMAMTLLLLLGVFWAVCAVAVFGAYFGALREEKMAGVPDEAARGQGKYAPPHTATAGNGRSGIPSPAPAKFVHRMEREAISQPPIEESWAVGVLMGHLTSQHDEFEDARDAR